MNNLTLAKNFIHARSCKKLRSLDIIWNSKNRFLAEQPRLVHFKGTQKIGYCSNIVEYFRFC